MLLTLGSLICLIFVFLGSRDAKNGFTNQFYFFKADASNFTNNPNINLIPGTNVDQQLIDQLTGAASANNLSDFYQVGLWDYCSGTNSSSGEKVTFCSKPQSSYWFNPIDVWGLQNTTVEEAFPKELKDGLNAYQKAAHWMFVAYVVALSITAGEIVVGFFAVFSRWGSCVTTILAAVTSTVVSSIVVGALDATLKPYGIKSSLGTKMLTVVWLAVAFSLAAGLFWTFSTCCCSGKSGMKRDGGIRRAGTIVERTPYTHEYKPLGEGAYGNGTHSVPLNTMVGAHSRHESGGFEPYRPAV
jgi:hypothetical protein